MSDHKLKLRTSVSRIAASKSTPKSKAFMEKLNAVKPNTYGTKIVDVDTETLIIPSIDGLLADSLTIIGNELARYRAKTARGASLELKEARAVQGYMESLVKLSKESREQSRHEDFASLSDEELLSLAAKTLSIVDEKDAVEEKTITGEEV